MVKRELKLFFDMDETIVNLTESIVREFNKDYKCNYDYKQNRSYWWGDTLAPAPIMKNYCNKRIYF